MAIIKVPNYGPEDEDDNWVEKLDFYDLMDELKKSGQPLFLILFRLFIIFFLLRFANLTSYSFDSSLFRKILE